MREIYYLCPKVTSTVLITNLMADLRQLFDFQLIMICKNFS